MNKEELIKLLTDDKDVRAAVSRNTITAILMWLVLIISLRYTKLEVKTE